MSVGWLIGRCVGLLPCLLHGWQVCWLCWLDGWYVALLVGWLISWFVGLLVGRLVRWLVGWLFNLLVLLVG